MDILLYSYIYDWSAEALINKLDAAEGAPVVRINSGGGSPISTYGIMAKFKELGNVKVKVDGIAMSSALYLLAFAAEVEALDVSTFLLHRADGPSDTPEAKAFLDKVNKDLRAGFEKKVPGETFQKITGYSYDQVFDPQQRINITFDAKQAKKMGLVNKVVSLTPEAAYRIAAAIDYVDSQQQTATGTATNAATTSTATITTGGTTTQLTGAASGTGGITPQSNQQTKRNMTIEQFRADHPALYEQVYNAGAAAERDRVEAAMVFATVDLDSVKTIIAEGKPMSMKQIAELNQKQIAALSLKGIEGAAAPAAGTQEPEGAKKPEEVAAENFLASVKAHLKTTA